jgi:hypothetical protein
VTALHIRCSTLRSPSPDSTVVRADDEEDSGAVSLHTLYALRGDRRVFRSIRVRAYPRPSAGAAGHPTVVQWQMEWTHGADGPPAHPRGLLSQTIGLQTFAPSAELDAPEAAEGSAAAAHRKPAQLKVLASQIDWLRSPLSLAGPLVATQQSKWGTPAASSSIDGGGGGRGRPINRRTTFRSRSCSYRSSAAVSFSPLVHWNRSSDKFSWLPLRLSAESSLS